MPSSKLQANLVAGAHLGAEGGSQAGEAVVAGGMTRDMVTASMVLAMMHQAATVQQGQAMGMMPMGAMAMVEGTANIQQAWLWCL